MSDSAATRRPTMADVARAAGVSLSTVDRVLNLRANVRADTAQRIATAAAKLGFHAQGVIEQRLRHDKPTLRLGFLLQKSGVAFYQGLAQALAEAAAATARARVRVMIGYLDDLDPLAVARRIEAQRGEVDALGVVAVDHVAVREAVSELRLNGMPVLAMISELATRAGAGYLGVDNRRMGRVAGWFVTRLARQPGPVAVMVGSQRFQCQELCELSFRSYLAEAPGDWELLASRLTLEDPGYARGNTLDLLAAYPDLTGLYVAGGGIEGVIQALQDLHGQGLPLPTVVCHDLTPVTRQALRSGLVQAVLSHPRELLARRAVDALVAASLDNGQPGYELLPLQLDVPECH
ncbi:LacI family DNA-binding transcriptional regulator [uncultured Pseudomonas sp.]|uniref:LacI family DNA-binding transcriptional regulator n=1 Tax=uncultured Pseudomonas sp. TaxID=114707 RepID=UPI0025DA6C80|nr:LacI family DNA-binding transcriptional regulator [uncultured Pseudomonas sp.]